MSLSDRLSQVMAEKNITIDNLKDIAGVTYEMARRYKLGTAEPRRDKLEQIAEALNVDPSWLQFGKENNGVIISGSSLNNSPVNNSVNEIQPEPVSYAQYEQDEEHSHCLVHLDVNAAAGVVEYTNSDNPEVIQRIWLSDDGMLELVGKRSTNGLAIINVPTDSMEPTIPKGSMVVLDTLVKQYSGEGVYAFSREGNLFIKRLQKRIAGGYLVISDNKPKYQDEVLDNEFIDNAKFVGKFVRLWKMESIEL